MALSPFPYQELGANLMASRPRVYNADQPGLGKTLQTLLALKKLGKPTAAVLCPAIARTMWRQASEEVLGMPLAFVESYDRYTRNVGARETLKQLDPSVLILDEAHLLSNMHAQRTQDILLNLRHIPVIWPLSGTPLRTNGPAGLFPLLAAAWPEELRALDIKSYREYLDTFCHYFEHPRWGVQVRGVRRAELWNKLWKRVAFRRTMEEVLPQLPPMTWEELILDPPKHDSAEVSALREYEAQGDWHDLLTALDCDMLDPAAEGTSTLRRLIGEAKAPISASIVADDLEGGTDKVFVTAYHHNVLDVLERELAPYGVLRVDGSTNDRDRERARIAFQTTDRYRVYLGQIIATQMSVTLTAAAVAHMVEPTWVPDDNTQSAQRIRRIGQGRPTVVRMHTLAGTLDEAVSRVLVRRQRTNAQALGEPTQAAPVRR